MKSTIFVFSTDKQILVCFCSKLLQYMFLRIPNILCLFGVPIALENSTIPNQGNVGHKWQVLLLSVTYLKLHYITW